MSESIRRRPRAEDIVGTPGAVVAVDSELSDVFLAASRWRLIAAVLVALTAIAVYFVLYRTVWRASSDLVSLGVNVYAFLAGMACLVALRDRRPSRRRLVATGVFFQGSLALVLCVSEAVRPQAGPTNLISWNAANILLVPLLVPMRPRAILAFTALLAALTPLTLETVPRLAQTGEWTATAIVSMSIPPAICAALAYFPSHVLDGLHRELASARRLGAYDLVERLDEGGMGEVWRATHRLLARPAAIKLVRPALLAAGSGRAARAIARFEREAKVTAALQSPHTVELYDFGVAHDGSLYYVMELLCGLDLMTLVERFGPLPPERVVYLLEQICDSLEEAHRAGLVHRDIKPANIFVSRRADHYDWVKVLDFGLVKARDLLDPHPAGAEALSGEDHVIGTPAFIAPEVAVGDGPVDGRADLYSLGCVAYFALTGGFVFEGTTAIQVAVAHVTESPAPPSARVAQAIPPDLDAAVLACLEKKPEARPESARALAGRLRAIRFDSRWDLDKATEYWRVNLPEHFHA